MVFVHLANGFEEIEAFTVVDLLRRADIDAETVSVSGRLNVTGAHKVEVIADILFEDAVYDGCDMIVLPGGGGGAMRLAAHDGLREKLYSFHNSGRKIAAICASPSVVLGPLGILEGRRATCYPGMEKGMEGAIFAEGDVVSDGHITTSRGPATSIAFALALIEILKDTETKERVAGELLYAKVKGE
jgi:4-methyl-5(b-hydroxyethyl)-thiazole monophosphate biosynthesis